MTQNGHQPHSFNVDSFWCCLLQFANRRDDNWRALAWRSSRRSAKLFPVRSMNQAELKSPRISHLLWGHVEVEGHPPFKDTRVFPGGAREWDWRETGTHHVPGIQPADVQELIEHGAKAGCCLKGSGRDLRFAPKPLRFWPRTALRSRSYRPRLQWSALTSFVKACRSAAYFIRPAD